MTALKIISTIVENKPGVLFRVSNMIRRRGFNIESITVGTIDHKDVSRMTLTLRGDDATVEQVVKQLIKLIDVLEAKVFTPEEVTARELVLIRLAPEAKTQIATDALKDARIVDTSPGSITLELTGGPEVIEQFVQRVGSSNILGLARTGVTALPRGDRV